MTKHVGAATCVLVEERDLPSAVFESLAPARILHDPIEGHELREDDLAHLSLPSIDLRWV
jgi:hypothetical protein